MLICFSRAGKKEATAGRQSRGGGRGPEHLKIFPQWCLWKRSPLLGGGGGGWGTGLLFPQLKGSHQLPGQG